MDPITGGTYRIANVERVQHTHLVPHIGLDPTRSSSFLLVNPSATTASTGRLVFFGPDGVPVTPRADALKGGSFSVPPLGVVAIDAFAPQTPVVSSAQIFTNVPVGVSVQTASTALGAFAAAESPLIDGAIVPLSEDQAGGTGVIITNSVLRSRLKLSVRNAAGGELECCSATVDLPPYAQRTVWVRDLFPRLGEFQGALSVEVGSDRPQEGGPLTIVALQRRGGAVTASQVVRMAPGLAGGPLVFSSITAGGDAASLILLVNPSNTVRARGTVSFSDQQGRPWSIAVNRQPAAPTAAFDLGPLGSVVLTIATSGPIQAGVARVETKEGSVGGVVRNATAATVADAAPASAATAFVAAVVRDRATGVTTELAITSSGTAATVQMALHDRSGAPVAGAATQIRVPANGQIVRTFDDLFPNVTAPALYSTIVATSDQPVAVTVTRSGAGARANLPVLPTR
jgi:hypothetical protein